MSVEELNLDKKESEVEVSLQRPQSGHTSGDTPSPCLCVCVCVQEAKAIIAQRSWNPREFFKQKERAMTISVDTSPVSVHRTGGTFIYTTSVFSFLVVLR